MKTPKRLLTAALLSAFALPVLASSEVNVNKADANTLMHDLNGVNSTLAHRIVRYRDQNGPYVGLYELGFVNGVGRKFFLSNLDRMTVGHVSLADKHKT